MAQSTSARITNTQMIEQYLTAPVEASTVIWNDCCVCFNGTSGGLVMAQDVAGLVFAGIANGTFNNGSGTLGAIVGQFQPLYGINGLNYIQLDAVSPTQAWVGQLCYFTDDHTAAISGTTNSILVGRVVQIINSSSAGRIVVDLTGRTAK